MRNLVIGLLVMAAPATAQTPGFEVSIDRTIAASPAAVYERLVDIGRWWTPSHSYSGDSANLTLEPKAGGCWCENWGAGSVEHGRVLTAMPGKLLRISGGLGPLQERPMVAVLTFTLTPRDGGKATALGVRYRVAGAVSDLSAPVTDVLGQQVERLVSGFVP